MKRIFAMMALLLAAVSFNSCDHKQGDDVGLNADFYITSDKDVIKSDGVDKARIIVYLQGKDVTADAIIYDADFNPVTLEDGCFATTTQGAYKFCAYYGTYSTYNRNYEDNGLYTINAIPYDVPQPAEDTAPANLDFVHRAFLTQYTGTGCGYCPYMTKIIKSIAAEGVIPAKAVIAAAHSGYNSNDPAAINRPKVSNYPYLHVDLVNGFTHNNGADVLKALIDQSIAPKAKAGIAVNSVLYREAKKLVVTVSVKAAEAGLYNVGAWLLEDDIYARQDDYDNQGEHGVEDVENSYDYHDNCVRIVDSDYMGTFFGRLIGNMKAGETVEKTFVMDLKIDNGKKSDWVTEKLHLAVFVSNGQKSGSKISYSVCNAVDCKINKEYSFEYR